MQDIQNQATSGKTPVRNVRDQLNLNDTQGQHYKIEAKACDTASSLVASQRLGEPKTFFFFC